MALEHTKLRALVVVVVFAAVAAGVYLLVRQFGEDPELAAAKELLTQREFSEASRHLKTYLTTHPQDVNARLLAAQTARRDGKFSEAKRLLQALEADRVPGELLRTEYRCMALMQGELSGLDEAAKQCRERPGEAETALLLEASIVGGLNALAPPFTTHTPYYIDVAPPLLAKLEPLVDLWLETRGRPSDRIAGLVWRGRVRELSRDHVRAIADLRKVLHESPNHFEAAFYLALFLAQEDLVGSHHRLEALRQRYPDDPQVLFALASGLHSLGRLDEAAKLFDRVIAANPTVPTALVERGLVALDAQKPAEAEPLLRKALAISPQDADTHLALARCMRLLGKTEEANQFQDRFRELEAGMVPGQRASVKKP